MKPSIVLSAWITVVLILSFSCLVVWRDYRITKEATQDLVALQEEYRSYIATFKRVLDDLSKDIEQETLIDSEMSDEKKKPFLIVDRRPQYLKQSLLHYIKEKELSIDVNEIDRIYQSYTDKTAQHINKRIIPKDSKRRISAVANRIQRRKPLIRDAIFSWPLEANQFWISSFFGKRKRSNGSWGFHYGIDLAAIKGTPVKAVASGRVVQARFVSGYGNTVLLAHNNKYKSRYAHLQKIQVKQNQIVKRGQLIGTVGDTGYVRSSGRDASHLHLEIHRFGQQVNPLYFLA